MFILRETRRPQLKNMHRVNLDPLNLFCQGIAIPGCQVPIASICHFLRISMSVVGDPEYLETDIFDRHSDTGVVLRMFSGK